MALADLLDRYAVETPNKPALIEGDRSLTYGALRTRARALAAALQAEGVVPGARVAVLDENTLAFPVLVGAAAYGGFTLVPVNVRLHLEEIGAILGDAGATLAFVGGNLDWRALAAAAPELRWIELESDSVARMIERGAAAPMRSSPGDALVQFATGGTTGVPKGCLVTEANIFAQTVNFMDAIGLAAGDRYGLVMPFFHMAAGGMAIALLTLGATGVLLPRRDPEALMTALAHHRVTRANLPAATLRDIRASAAFRRLPDLRWLGAGNGSESDLLRALANTICPDVWGWYGQTEATNITTSPRSTAEALTGFGCIGRPALTARVRVVDERGQDVKPGEVGELWTAGPHVMGGYWRREAETAATMSGAWLRSGDLVRQGSGGSLFIVDRLKETIKSGGETIYPRELELILERHPAIAEAAVIGVRHPRWGESPRALVVLEPGVTLDADAVIAHCRAHLASFKRPTSVLFVGGLPRNIAGKVRKDVLRREWGAIDEQHKWAAE